MTGAGTNNSGEVLLVPEVGHTEALQKVGAAQQLEADGSLQKDR